MSDKIEVTVGDGKYKFTFEGGKLLCERYNEPWRDFVGDKAVLSLVQELAEARAENEQLKAQLRELASAEPVAWRYTDARGHFRYRGACPGFDSEYPILRPEALIRRPEVPK